MKALMAVLILALAVPAAAQEKSKKDDKKQAPAPAASSPDQLMREAEQKAAAGDKDGAAELLRRAVAMPAATGEPSMRLGRLLEGKYEFDAAIDAYKVAGDKLTGAAKGEALGRMAVLQQVRGMPEASATAQAAAAADPQGVWPATAAALAEGDAEAQRLVQEVGVAQALAYLATNQPDLAIQDLTKLRDQHDSAEVRVGLARAYIAKRQGDLAATELQKAVELEPN